MTLPKAKSIILASIKVDDGKEDKEYTATGKAYSDCFKRIPALCDRVKFDGWYNDLKRNFKKT